MKRNTVIATLAALALLWLISVATYVVSETEQALIIRLGAPIGMVNTPGLNFKLPLVDSVILYDSRELLLEPPLEQVILGDQKRSEVQTYARYRITDPLQFYQSLRTPKCWPRPSRWESRFPRCAFARPICRWKPARQFMSV